MSRTAPEPVAQPIVVSREGLASLLAAFRLRRDEHPDAVETRLRTGVKQRGLARTVDGDTLVVRPGRVTWLERGGAGVLTLTESDWQLLSDAYGIPRLMLDPLRVASRKTECLTQPWHRLVPLGGRADPEYGSRVRYYAPEAKREGTEEAAFVLLELAPGGQSQVHAHPGDELLFVLGGEVEARLETTGLAVRLAAGDYLHFYAEQRHGLRNPGASPARVFVIRFYQLGRSGTRFELLRQLRQTRQNRHVTSRAVGEMIALLTPVDLREEVATGEVRDRGGLGRLLQLLASGRFRGAAGPLPVRTLAARLTSCGLDYTHSKVDRMHHGQAQVPASDLECLAEVYGAEPLLLFEFLYPALRPAIAVRHETDYRDVPPQLLGGSRGGYRVPCRRLADSDLGVAQLILPPGTATPVNRHPGHELVVPLAGRAKIRIGGMTTEVAAGEHVFAHYSSEDEHQVLNEAADPAQLLVVRFYE